MRTRHAGFETHKIDEMTPRDSTRGRTRHSRHCTEGRITGIFAGDARTCVQTTHRPCLDDAHTMRSRSTVYSANTRTAPLAVGAALRGNQTRGRSEEADVPVGLRQRAGRRVSAQTGTHGGREHGRA